MLNELRVCLNDRPSFPSPIPRQWYRISLPPPPRYAVYTPCVLVVFADAIIRLRRTNDDHDAEDPVHCPNLCGRFYRGVYRKSNLRRHLFECGVLPRYSCPVCDKWFFRRYQLKMHLAVVHKWISSRSSPRPVSSNGAADAFEQRR